MTLLLLLLSFLSPSHAGSPAFAALVSSGDVPAALAVARSLSSSSEGGFEWVSAHARVERLRGLPAAAPARGGGPRSLAAASASAPRVEFVSVTLEDGRTVDAHVESARGLPVGERVPLRGVIYGGIFYNDADAAHACRAPPAADGSVVCVVGGAAPERFESEAAAAERARAERTAASRAIRESLRLAPLPATVLGMGAAAHGRAPRELQLGAAMNSSLSIINSAPSNSLGVRTAVCVNILFADQTSASPGVIAAADVARACSNMEVYHTLRAFGAMKLKVTTKPCYYKIALATTDLNSGSSGSIMSAMKTALSTVGSTDGGDCPADAKSYQHFVVFFSWQTVFSFCGLGSAPGSSVWIHGQGCTNEGAGLAVVAHEIGHNYGLQHASVWPLNSTASVEYGDATDVMGSGRGYLGLCRADYSAATKFAMGWIPESRVVNVQRGAAGVSVGSVTSGVFLLAAADRNFDADLDGDLRYVGRMPANVALTARTLTPRRWYSDAPGDSFAYLTYRANLNVTGGNAPLNGKGVYINELPIGSNSAGHPFLVCYRDPFCTQFPPIQHYDAFIFSPNDTRTLIEVGPRSVIFDTARPDDGALLVRVAQLDRNGLSIDGASPLGCHAGGCASLPDVTIVPPLPPPSSSTFPISLSNLSPTAVFSISAPSSTSVAVSTCIPGVTYPAIASLSAFYGGFPASHAYYGGNVGLTGDANAPGSLNASAVWPSGCTHLNVFVGAGATVWIVAGSPGPARGTSMSGGVVFTFSSGASASTYPLASPTAVSGGCASWGSTVFFALPGGGANVYFNGNNKWLRFSAAAKAWGVFSAASDASATNSGGMSCSIAGTSNRTDADPALIGVCPVGTYKTNAGCVACPLVSHVSPQGVVSSRTDSVYASARSQCYCPYSWFDSADATKCVGPSVGGPTATDLVSGVGCPVNFWSVGGACSVCPVGTSGPNCGDAPQYAVVEVVSVGGLPAASYAGIFSRTNVTQNGRLSYRGRTSTRYWVYYGGSSWRVTTVATTAGWFYASPTATTLLHNVTAASRAFCDGPGASTVDFASRRVCFCGEGTYAGADGFCYACPEGTFRAIGGASSTVETCAACAAGTASPTNAAACSPACPSGTTQVGSRCMPSTPLTCAVGSAPSMMGGGLCVACAPQFACDGATVRVCPHHTVANAAGTACVCAAGYASLAGASCAPPRDVSLTSQALSLVLSLARLQYVAFRVPAAAVVIGAQPCGLVWRASPVYATTAAPFATLYHAWGGPWGLNASTALTHATFSRAGADFGVAGTAWALDSSATAALLTAAAGGGAGANAAPAAARAAASFGAAAHALDVVPLASAGAVDWFLFNFSALRSFPHAASVALAAGTARSAPRLIVTAPLDALFSGGVARVSLNGSVGAGDRVAIVPASTPCESVVDAGATAQSEVYATDLSIVSLDAAVSAVLRVPPTSGSTARALCVSMAATAWNSTGAVGPAVFTAVLLADSQPLAFAASAPPPPASAPSTDLMLVLALTLASLALVCAVVGAIVFVRRRKRGKAAAGGAAAAATAATTVVTQFVENPLKHGGDSAAAGSARRFRRVVDEADGAVFFEDVDSDATEWALPLGAVLVDDDGCVLHSVPHAHAPHAAPPARRFRKAVDETDGAVFYEDVETLEAHWTLPRGAALVDHDGRLVGAPHTHAPHYSAPHETARRFRRVVDDADGAVFYENVETLDAHWTLPRGAALVDAFGRELHHVPHSHAPREAPPARRFRRVIDGSDGAVFYEDVETGEAAWRLPPGAALVDETEASVVPHAHAPTYGP
jgi:hypothetical protein